MKCTKVHGWMYRGEIVKTVAETALTFLIDVASAVFLRAR